MKFEVGDIIAYNSLPNHYLLIIDVYDIFYEYTDLVYTSSSMDDQSTLHNLCFLVTDIFRQDI